MNINTVCLDIAIRTPAYAIVIACVFALGWKFYFKHIHPLVHKGFQQTDSGHWLLEAFYAATLAGFTVHWIGVQENLASSCTAFFVCLAASWFWKLPPFRCIWRQSFTMIAAIAAVTAAVKPIIAVAFIAALLTSLLYWTKKHHLNISTVLITLTGAVALAHYFDLWTLLAVTSGVVLERVYFHSSCRLLNSSEAANLGWQPKKNMVRTNLCWLNGWTGGSYFLVYMLFPWMSTAFQITLLSMAVLCIVQLWYSLENCCYSGNEFLWG